MTNHEELNNKFAAALMEQTEINDQIRQLAIDCGAVADRFDAGDLYFENNLQFLWFVSKLNERVVIGEQTVQIMPDWLTYDYQHDVLTIHGRRYSGSMFGETGFLAPPGTLLRVEKSYPDTVVLTNVQQQEPVANCEAGPEFCPVGRAETRSLALAAAVGYIQRNTPTLVWTEICNALTTTPPAQPAIEEDMVSLWASLVKKHTTRSGNCNFQNAANELAQRVAAKLTLPQRKPLTDEDIQSIANQYLHFQIEGYEVSGIYNFVRAIEAVHGITEKGGAA
jgi:hypothetical protein